MDIIKSYLHFMYMRLLLSVAKKDYIELLILIKMINMSTGRIDYYKYSVTSNPAIRHYLGITSSE